MIERQLSQNFLDYICNQENIESVANLGDAKPIKDTTGKYIVGINGKTEKRFMLVSRIDNGDIATRSALNTRKISSTLSAKTALGVVAAQSHGTFENHSYAIFPKYYPLSHNRIVRKIECYWILPKVVSWHKAFSAETKVPFKPEESPALIERLKALQDCFSSEKNLSKEIRNTILRIKNRGTPELFTCASHDDLWWGNVLKTGRLFGDARIIDWAGLDMHGNAFFDLIRMLLSFRPSHRYAKKLLTEYTTVFDCDLVDVKLYLYISAANLFNRLEYFPLERFQNLVIECRNYLAQITETAPLATTGSTTEH